MVFCIEYVFCDHKWQQSFNDSKNLRFNLYFSLFYISSYFVIQIWSYSWFLFSVVIIYAKLSWAKAFKIEDFIHILLLAYNIK